MRGFRSRHLVISAKTMGVVIESDVWQPSPLIFLLMFVSCFLSIVLLPHFSTNSGRATTTTVFDHGAVPSSLRLQRNFLLLFSLSSVLEGLWSVFGDFEMTNYGLSKEQMVLSLCVGFTAALFVGPFFGMSSDIMGQKKVCLLFFILHLVIAIWKKIIAHPSIYLASVLLSLATSIFSFSFETWMVIEHDKLGHRKDALNDMFWLMTFCESASLIGSQALANWMAHINSIRTHMISPFSAVILLAVAGIIYITRVCKEVPQTVTINDYTLSFCKQICCDKRILLLVWTQACVQFATVIFWILWAPTMVADGREVLLGLIYPCLLGARMVGSTAFPWLLGPLSFRIEDYQLYTFATMGVVLSILAYDYQEVEVLFSLFCLFHACLGLVLPSLARLRTMYVPNELRGGMICLSLATANAATLLFLLGNYCKSIENSTVISLAALGLFSAASCMYILKRWGKQLHPSRHEL